MTKLRKLRLPLLIILALTAAAGLAVSINNDNEVSRVVFANANSPATTGNTKIAYVTGAVNKPGVYEIEATTTIAELISRADGFREDADKDFLNTELNLAAVVEDHQHIEIPLTKRAAVSVPSSISTPGKVSINTASATELDTLPGVGPALAASIISARPFNALSDLQNVKGIGEAKFATLLPLITL